MEKGEWESSWVGILLPNNTNPPKNCNYKLDNLPIIIQEEIIFIRFIYSWIKII